MLAGPDGDNALIIGPAGTVHLSILDFAAWGGWQAGEARRGPALVRPETLKKLHSQVIAIPAHDAPPGTPPSGCYCLGWGIATMPFARERKRARKFSAALGRNSLRDALKLMGQVCPWPAKLRNVLL